MFLACVLEMAKLSRHSQIERDIEISDLKIENGVSRHFD